MSEAVKRGEDASEDRVTCMNPWAPVLSMGDHISGERIGELEGGSAQAGTSGDIARFDCTANSPRPEFRPRPSTHATRTSPASQPSQDARIPGRG